MCGEDVGLELMSFLSTLAIVDPVSACNATIGVPPSH